MLRTRAIEVSLWEAVLPEEVLGLPKELARVDALLDDPVFFAPFVPFFDPRLGRPSTPMEVYAQGARRTMDRAAAPCRRVGRSRALDGRAAVNLP